VDDTGLEFDGNADIDSLRVKYAIRTADDGTQVTPNYVFKVFDCYFHDIVIGSDGNAFRAYARTFADTVLFENCLVVNTGKEGIRLRDEENERPEFGFYNVNYFEVTNSTFYNIVHDAISVYGGDSEPNTPGPTVRINHVTVHRAGHYGISLKVVDDAEVRNSIITDNLDFMERTGKTKGGPWLSSQATISHCDTMNVGGRWTGGQPAAASIFALDPMFVDPAGLDFSFQNSDLLTLADDGGALGDRRWAPGGATSVDLTDIAQELPEAYVLHQNYPNPFNPQTAIRFAVTERTPVKLEIFNVRGELVETLVDELTGAGEHTVWWDASGVASGIYYYRLAVDGQVITKKMTFLR
jgi:hypothetical protein